MDVILRGSGAPKNQGISFVNPIMYICASGLLWNKKISKEIRVHRTYLVRLVQPYNKVYPMCGLLLTSMLPVGNIYLYPDGCNSDE